MKLLLTLAVAWVLSFTSGCDRVAPEAKVEVPAVTPAVVSMASAEGGEVQMTALPTSAPTPQSAIVFEKGSESARYSFSDGNTVLNVEAGELTVRIAGQAFKCEIIVADEASVHLILSEGAAFTGTFRASTASAASITLDETSTWALSDDTAVGALIDADSTFQNIDSKGFSLSYDSEHEANAPLAARSFKLIGGGYLMPII